MQNFKALATFEKEIWQIEKRIFWLFAQITETAIFQSS